MLADRDVHMRKVSNGIGSKWRDMGRRLLLSEADMYDIHSRFHLEGSKEVALQVLLKWQSVQGKQATLQRLVDVLYQLEEYILAQSLVSA